MSTCEISTAVAAHIPFACPICKIALDTGAISLNCPSCHTAFPIANGIPVLINESRSVFRTADYVGQSSYTGASGYGGHLEKNTGLRAAYRRWVHRLKETPPPSRDFDVHAAVAKIHEEWPEARILAIGSGDATIPGSVFYTDVAFGKHVQCIADAHDLPFADGSFDACIIVAVLEHVLDPNRCVSEIQRILRPGGFVYAETPFMQPVHMGAFDFTRFTYLGHRRLFRYFEKVADGIAGGPGVSTVQMLNYLAASVTARPGLKRYLRLATLVISHPFRNLDRLTNRHDAAYDSASGFYFFGRLTNQPLCDRELLKTYRGG